MFLNTLNETQKNYYLDLAIKAAQINGTMTVEEKSLLKTYAVEMNIAPRYETQAQTEDVLKALTDISSVMERKIVLFEILGMMYADTEYDNVERAFIDDIAKSFALSAEVVKQMNAQITAYAKLMNEICKTVLE